MSMTVEGPAWSPSGLDVAAGRYPLSVEQHVLRMVAVLVPGVTTVTLNSRYYALHALAGDEAVKRGLEGADALDLLRRMEVVIAGASLSHQHTGYFRPHGADVIGPRMDSLGRLDVAALSRPGKKGYVEARGGYWPPYAGSELLLGITTPGTVPAPGPRCDVSAIHNGLSDLIELAMHDELSQEDVAGASHLCLCQAAGSDDGIWLRGLLAADNSSSLHDDFLKADKARRDTARLLATACRDWTFEDFVTQFVEQVAFGNFIHTDSVAADLDVADVWRGVLLRRYSVGAWRRLWAWVVNELIDDLVSPDDVLDGVADVLPDSSVQDFVRSLPNTTTEGEPVASEDDVRNNAASIPAAELGVLAIGAARSRELTGSTADAFRGKPVELGPEWMARRLDTYATQNLRDFGRQLTKELIARSQRFAIFKMRRRDDGTLWLPTRVYEKGGLLFKTSNEGSGDVSTRIGQFGRILGGVGIFEETPDGWELTDEGARSLDV